MASELSVSTHEVVSFVEELGKKVRGPSTVIGVSVAAKVRSRFRAGRSTGSAPAQPTTAPATAPAAAAPSLFLPPVAPPQASVSSSVTDLFANPFAVPDSAPAFRAPAPRPPATPPPPDRAKMQPALPAVQQFVTPPVEDFDAAWRRRGFDRDEQDMWCGSGIRPQDAALADQCRMIGIEPADLPRKLSGRTVLQRLRDGESTTSVWARIQEAEQQPRRAGTKLTGRFQLN